MSHRCLGWTRNNFDGNTSFWPSLRSTEYSVFWRSLSLTVIVNGRKHHFWCTNSLKCSLCSLPILPVRTRENHLWWPLGTCGVFAGVPISVDERCSGPATSKCSEPPMACLESVKDMVVFPICWSGQPWYLVQIQYTAPLYGVVPSLLMHDLHRHFKTPWPHGVTIDWKWKVTLSWYLDRECWFARNQTVNDHHKFTSAP